MFHQFLCVLHLGLELDSFVAYDVFTPLVSLCLFVVNSFPLWCVYLFIQEEAVYGLTEVLRDEIRNARLVANPGCYPTSIQLPLVPLIKVRINKSS